MQNLINEVIRNMIFWMAWVIIPLVMEICPAVGGFFILLRKKLSAKPVEVPIIFPEITMIIPVYNSESTLRECLKSIHDSTYPDDKITLLLTDNKSTDNSFKTFCDCQKEFPTLSMQWNNAEQGKSKALNLALFNSTGKYIIHIDSDGTLAPSAIENMVKKFESNNKIHCMTGVILTNPKQIDETKKFSLRLLRKCEFFEYCQAFLAGRNFESEFDNIYTLSGAFSAFRKSTILKTQLYNTDTVCEDTHVTFQIKKILNKRVNICEDALFFVDPIDNAEKLYTQRQRWQIGELEVSHMFFNKSLKSRSFFSDMMIRVLMFDHTFAFPRMIWYFALICLAFLNYPFKLIVGSICILYFLYMLSAFLFYLNVISYLKNNKELKNYYAKKWYIIILMPIYNFVVFWIRFAGIINSIKTRSGWKVSTLSEENKRFFDVLKSDFGFLITIHQRLKSVFNTKN